MTDKCGTLFNMKEATTCGSKFIGDLLMPLHPPGLSWGGKFPK